MDSYLNSKKKYLLKQTNKFFRVGGNKYPIIDNIYSLSNKHIVIELLYMSKVSIYMCTKLATISSSLFIPIALFAYNSIIAITVCLIFSSVYYFIIKSDRINKLTLLSNFSSFTIVLSGIYSYFITNQNILAVTKFTNIFINIIFVVCLPYLLYPTLRAFLFLISSYFANLNIRLSLFKILYKSIIYIFSFFYIIPNIFLMYAFALNAQNESLNNIIIITFAIINLLDNIIPHFNKYTEDDVVSSIFAR